MNTASGDTIASAIPEKNPLRISTIIARILEFLPLRDIKNCRLIAREWNSLSEPLLRKKAKILITPNFGTSDYLEFYSDSRHSTLPFTAFKFTQNVFSTKGFFMSDLDDFFNQCGKNINSLELNCITIWTDQNHREPQTKALDINRWITLLSDNMDKLTIKVSDTHSTLSTNLQLSLENLAGVKSLLLSQCGVIVNCSSNTNRIAPSEISLTDVQFLNQSEKKLTDVIVNDFVDFSKCSNIYLCQRRYTAMTFDMSKDIVDAKKLQFYFMKVLNSGFSKIKTDSLFVWDTPPEAIKMQMKELDVGLCSSINLTHLPQTIEKLKIAKSGLVPDITLPLDLPKLKYLQFDQSPGRGGRLTPIALCVKTFLSWFKNCSNIVELHLESLCPKSEFDVAWLPKSVKRLKLSKLDGIVFVGDGAPIDVDVLLLDDWIVSSEVDMLMEKIKPKMLVMTVKFHTGLDGEEEADHFISFVKKNTQLEKIVINTRYGLGGKDNSPGKNRFLKFVGEESPCYEFNNQIAKAMSEEEYIKIYYDIKCISAEYF